MIRAYTALVLCASPMMRDAIQQALKAHGLSVLTPERENLPICGATRARPDVAIIVSSCHGAPPDNRRLDDIAIHAAANWVVLSGNLHDPVAVHLSSIGASVCVVPDEVGAAELAHVAMLAAAGNRVSVGRFCDAGSPMEARRILDADLDDQQWRLMTFLAEGCSNKVIARAEGTTEATIKARIRGLLQRLDVENRTQAAVIAARAGLRHKAISTHATFQPALMTDADDRNPHVAGADIAA